jgi:hypothetical protein
MKDRALRKALVDAGMLFDGKNTICTTMGYKVVPVLQGLRQALPVGPDYDYVERQIRQLQDRVDALAKALGYEYKVHPKRAGYEKKGRK